jgi:hypothetical protein
MFFLGADGLTVQLVNARQVKNSLGRLRQP